ncbi:MAG: c-type cytochrome [Gammaproteobacteria bacterium]|jgi:cytochrome c
MIFLALVPGYMIPAAAAAMPEGERIAHGSDCFSCHAVDHTVVGPAFEAVAKRFAGKPDAVATLTKAVKNGHVGTWGKIPMPPHPQLSDKQLTTVVHWVLSLKGNTAGQAVSTNSKKTHTYTVDGKKVHVSFAVFKPGTKKVTKSVFRGYELFNSYCFRCHGPDALGGEYAPDLRQSLANGMTEKQFIDTAMVGRKAKGMPSWAGFFSPKEINAIYEYVKARSVKLVAEGRPPE